MRKRYWAALIFAVPLMWLPGCGDDDEGTGPGNEVSREAAQTAGLIALDFVNSSVENVDQLVLGDFTGLSRLDRAEGGGPAVVWNEASQAWIWELSASIQNFSFDWDFSVQFLSGGEVLTSQNLQSDVSNADGMNFAESSAVSETVGDDVNTFNYSNSFAVFPILGSRLAGAAPLDVTGSGAMAAFNATEGVDFDMSWDSDLIVPADDGCPAGTVAVAVQDWRITSTYSAETGTYEWQLFFGEQLLDSDSEQIDCANE